MFTQKQPNHPMQRKRRRLSEVAYPGFKKIRIIKRVTRRDPTEWFLFLTTMIVVAASIIGIVYILVMF
uniref:Uncharacterized protein n=1 Tax=viral metagenome TaxID=1070528 RepID=A0A6C0HME4_9ZZZZ